jgi:ABC-type multidrug transport system fused ATPase/permease subunit
LTVFLVVLVSAAAAYAVFLRPLNELVLNAGALVLGVWGIRAILLGANVPGFTVVDLSLMVVILFLLLAITWRALYFFHERSHLSLPLAHRTEPLHALHEPPAVNGADHELARGRR